MFLLIIYHNLLKKSMHNVYKLYYNFCTYLTKKPLPNGNGFKLLNLRLNELDNSHFSCVSAARTDLYDLSITAVSVSILR